MLRRFKISDRIYKIAKSVSDVFTRDIIDHTPNGPQCLDVDVDVVVLTFVLFLPGNKIDAIALDQYFKYCLENFK